MSATRASGRMFLSTGPSVIHVFFFGGRGRGRGIEIGERIPYRGEGLVAMVNGGFWDFCGATIGDDGSTSDHSRRGSVAEQGASLKVAPRSQLPDQNQISGGKKVSRCICAVSYLIARL